MSTKTPQRMSAPLTGEHKQKSRPTRSPDSKLWRPFERKEQYAESFNITRVACLEKKKGLSLSKSLQGKVATASQFTSSPIHVPLCSLSSFSTPQSVSNKLFSLFLSLLCLLSCLFFHCSEHLCCLLVWAISAWLLLCVLSCLCVYVCVLFPGSREAWGWYARRKNGPPFCPPISPKTMPQLPCGKSPSPSTGRVREGIRCSAWKAR